MEEMHRTHKEPVWGWVSVVAGLIKAARKPRGLRKVELKTTCKPVDCRVVTP
ncbi:hypothetical protein BH10PSE1_BH10PSE1_00270 [soil metagenome]